MILKIVIKIKIKYLKRKFKIVFQNIKIFLV